MRSLLLFALFGPVGALTAQTDTSYISTSGTFTYCYGDNEVRVHTAICTGSDGPMFLTACAGRFEACCDQLIVYDGTDELAPVLFAGNNDGDVAGLFFVGTNASNALTVKVLSNASVSCASEGYAPLSLAFGCGAFAECTVGISEEALAGPGLRSDGTGLVYVQVPWGISHAADVTVYDTGGRRVFRRMLATNGLSEVLLDLQALENGPYVLRVACDGRVAARSFVIAR